ncbi:hypothetical protein, partial [Modestobacter versicolor]
MAWVSELATRRALLLSCLLSALVLVIPVDGSAASVTALSAALTVALAAGLLTRAPRAAHVATRTEVSPDAPANDER